MLLDEIALGLLIVFSALGARRGAIRSGSALLTLIGGNALAVVGALWFGSAAASALGVPAVIGGLVAGTVAFVLAALGIGLAARAFRRAADARRGEAPRALADRLGGAFFGLARGAVLVLLLGVLALWLDAARVLATRAPPAPHEETPLRVATRAALETGMRAALPEDARGEAAALRVLTRPAETLGALRTIAENPGVPALLEDAAFWSDVEADRIDVALERPSLRRLADDPAVRNAVSDAGLIDPADADDPARFRAALRDVLAEAGPRIARLRSDPELRELAEDPQIAAALASGDVFVLMMHPELQQLAARALSAPPEP